MKTQKNIDLIYVRYPTGSRIQLSKIHNQKEISSLIEGTVHFADSEGMLHVLCDDGNAMTIDPDEYSIKSMEEPNDKVIYTDRRMKSVKNALCKVHAEFHIGSLVSQSQGEDMSYHGSPFYETISVIQGENKTYHHTDFETGYDRNEIVFEKVANLSSIKCAAVKEIYDEIVQLQKEIVQKKQELENLKVNSNLLSDQLRRDEQSEEMNADMCLKIKT